MSPREHDDFWSDGTQDDGPGQEPRKAEPAAQARHRLARPVTVLTLVAGALAVALVVGAVVSWLPSSSISAAAGVAPAGTGHLRGVRVAASRRPSATLPPPSWPAASPTASAVPLPPPAAVPPPAPKPKPAPKLPPPAPKPKPPPKPKPKPPPAPKPKPKPPPAPKPSKKPAAGPGPARLSLAPYFNNVGIASASNQDAGNLDGSGFAFSAEALAAAGARAGATITSHGVPFTWPDVAAGAPDNVVASGQTLQIKGAGKTLAFLLTAGWGPAAGTGEVVYASGATQKFTVDTPDWFTDCSRTTPGEVLYTPYRYPTDVEPDTYPVCVYYASVPLHAGQPVKQIVLPDVSGSVPQDGDPSLHIFAVTIH
jgi:outer membrane biosynthesis protein TonB